MGLGRGLQNGAVLLPQVLRPIITGTPDRATLESLVLIALFPKDPSVPHRPATPERVMLDKTSQPQSRLGVKDTQGAAKPRENTPYTPEAHAEGAQQVRAPEVLPRIARPPTQEPPGLSVQETQKPQCTYS